MTPEQFLQRILIPAEIAFPFKASTQSRALLLAIAGQESGWANRAQVPTDYAHSWWMFEREGVEGVMDHPSSGATLRAFCAEQAIGFDPDIIWAAITWHDGLAYALARLLLWTDPQPLPTVGNVENSWLLYTKLWRPGRPRPTVWATIYEEATDATQGPGGKATV
jgi:hypothetical protein